MNSLVKTPQILDTFPWSAYTSHMVERGQFLGPCRKCFALVLPPVLAILSLLTACGQPDGAQEEHNPAPTANAPSGPVALDVVKKYLGAVESSNFGTAHAILGDELQGLAGAQYFSQCLSRSKPVSFSGLTQGKKQGNLIEFRWETTIGGEKIAEPDALIIDEVKGRVLFDLALTKGCLRIAALSPASAPAARIKAFKDALKIVMALAKGLPQNYLAQMRAGKALLSANSPEVAEDAATKALKAAATNEEKADALLLRARARTAAMQISWSDVQNFSPPKSAITDVERAAKISEGRIDKNKTIAGLQYVVMFGVKQPYSLTRERAVRAPAKANRRIPSKKQRAIALVKSHNSGGRPDLTIAEFLESLVDMTRRGGTEIEAGKWSAEKKSGNTYRVSFDIKQFVGGISTYVNRYSFLADVTNGTVTADSPDARMLMGQ